MEEKLERMGTAVVGDRDSIYCYAALGLDVFPSDDVASARKTIQSLASQRYAVIFITEQLASQLEDLLEQYRDDMIPAIIPIPGISGNTGCGLSAVKKSVERAVGSDIIFGS